MSWLYTFQTPYRGRNGPLWTNPGFPFWSPTCYNIPSCPPPGILKKVFLQSNHHPLLFIAGFLHILFPGLECARPGNPSAQLMCCLLQEDFSNTHCPQRKTKFEKLGEVALLQAQPVLLNFLSPSWSPQVESFHLNVHCSASLGAPRGGSFSCLLHYPLQLSPCLTRDTYDHTDDQYVFGEGMKKQGT